MEIGLVAPRGTHLWEFIRDILIHPELNEGLMKWENRQEGVFKFLRSEAVAQLWGQKKKNSSMTYEKLSRAMRWAAGVPSPSHPSGWRESTVARNRRACSSCGQVMAWDVADWPAAHTELDLMSISLYHLQGLSHERHLVLKRALAMAHTIEVIKLLGSVPQFPPRPSLRFPPAPRPHCSMQSPRQGRVRERGLLPCRTWFRPISPGPEPSGQVT